MRGRFVRGVDNGTGRDPDANSRGASAEGGNKGDKVGSVQEDAFKKHSHKLPLNSDHQAKGGGGGRRGKWQEELNLSSEEFGGEETRPKNIYVNWIIKAKDM